MDRLDAAHVAIAAWGGLAVATCYLVGRRLEMGRIEAAGPAALMAVAGASIFFFAIPETYGVGAGVVALSILIVAGWRSDPPVVQGSAALVLGGCVTLPAVILPVVAVLRARTTWRRRLAQAIGAAVALAVLLVVQRVVFGTTIDFSLSGESQFVHSDVGRRFLLSVRTVLVDAWATPGPSFHGGVVTFSQHGWWSGGPLRLVAVILLAALWAVTASTVWRRRTNLVIVSCAAAVVVQVLLSSVYGDEPFLYAAPLVPMMVAIIAASSTPTTRRWVSGLCWLLVPVLVVLNLQHVHDAATLIAHNR
jgi:hypothetical protein